MFERLLKNYQKKLVNLSASNRSLVLLRLSKENDLDVHDLDFLLNKPSFHLIENLIGGRIKWPISPFMDSRNETANKVGKQLQRIDRKDRFLFEESGSRDLYVGWPYARGKFMDGTSVRCPLIFFPIELLLENNTWHLMVREDEPVSFNKSFLLAWRHYNQTQLPEDFEDFSFENFSKDPIEFRTQLYELLKTSGMEMNFNADLFIDKLLAFKTYKASDFAQDTEIGRIKLFNEAVLGIFPQAGSSLVPDYDALLESTEHTQMEDFLGGKLPDVSLPLREADFNAPLPLDASQEEAMRMVKRGQSIVVQGPPGTGKSQLICNLAADYMSRGKRVLVVCQKRAALDVVHARLSSLGVDTFVALVHDFKTDRGILYQKIAAQIEKVDEYKQANLKLDTVFLERDYLDACRKIDQTVQEIEQFKHALYDESESGFSPKELYLTIDRNLPLLAGARQYYKYFTQPFLNAFLNKLNYLLPYGLKFDAKDYPWKERKSFKGYVGADKTALSSTLGEIDRFKKNFRKNCDEFSIGISKFWELRSCVGFLEELTNTPKSEVFYAHFVKYILVKDAPHRIQKARRRLDALREKLRERANEPLVRQVKQESLMVVMLGAERAERKFRRFIGKLHWELTSKDKTTLKGLLMHNQLPYNAKGFAALGERLRNFQSFLLIKEEIHATKEFDFNEYEAIAHYSEEVDLLSLALDIAEKWLHINEKIEIPIQPQKMHVAGFQSKVKELLAAISHVEKAYVAKLGHFKETHLSQLFDKIDVNEELIALQHDFDSLVEYDLQKEGLEYQETVVLDALVSKSEGKAMGSNGLIQDHRVIMKILDNSIRIEWIDHIEAKNPILSSVSTPRMAMLEQTLQEAVVQKRKVSVDILLLKLREQVFKNEEFNRLGNRTTFRDLSHQVTKKKKIWPLRKTIEAFHEEVFYAMPCWLASPETVSAIFPLKKMFDLVIFDEASQCFSEKGIPAMARGEQVVVAGDSKQLQPSDLYRPRFEEEELDVAEAEIDSLLDLACRYLPQVMLTEHYRSRSLDLIDFSNTHFYKSRLQLLPDFHTYQSGHKGIEYVKVGGFFEGHSNNEEAEKVVDLCVFYFRTQPTKEIGVITFNIYQQYLIQDKLEARCVAEKLVVPDHFVVKNIENIQGDEKDIIIFSIGYAPDRSGRMSHHFGSLNLQGGENRLNVAVTRAREKVIVVTSITPQQLNVEDTMHLGPKLLKKYLEYALDVAEGRFAPVLPINQGFGPDWFLKEKMKRREPMKYVDEVPFADIVERDERGRFTQLVLTDDDRLYNCLSVKEVFSYFPTTLRSKNWKFERKFSRNYRG